MPKLPTMSTLRCCRLFLSATALLQMRVMGSVQLDQAEGADVPVCRRAQAPRSSSKGTNRVAADNWDPLYRLEVRQSKLDQYTVSVKLGSKLLPFSDAFISIETNGSCGVGELIYDDNDFFRVDQHHSDCPFLLTTNRKSLMQRLPPLRWKAPKCGCVHFRMMVLEASTIYYAEPPNVSGGPLATTICVGGSDGQHHKLSLEERTELLCQVTARFSGLQVLQRPQFLHRRRLQPKYLDLPDLELALSTRRYDITRCCSEPGSVEKKLCLGDLRRRRVDELCADGSPEVPFTVLRSRFMRQREKACCWRLGESRYSCFAVNSGRRGGSRSPDLSLDETDPLNDLGDYPDEIEQLEKEYGMALFSRDEEKQSSALTTPTPTSTPTPTPTTSTTTTTTTTSPTTTTTTAMEPLPLERRMSPNRPAVSTSPGKGSGKRRRNRKGRGRGRSQEVPVSTRRNPDFASGEIREQGGGRSTEKTYSKLQRRMSRLSLKAQCCQAGMSAALTTYGDFRAVWSQCSHSAKKHVNSEHVQQGHKPCAAQFHKCCMEAAVSSPAEVVTWRPDSASSVEWDRDRHQIHVAYFPPYARSQPVSSGASSTRQREPDSLMSRPMFNARSTERDGLLNPRPRSSAERHSRPSVLPSSRSKDRADLAMPRAGPSAERRSQAQTLTSSKSSERASLTGSAKERLPLDVDEPEIDERPEEEIVEERRPRKRNFKARGGKAKKSRWSFYDAEEINSDRGRRQRRLRKQQLRGGRSRSTARMGPRSREMYRSGQRSRDLYRSGQRSREMYRSGQRSRDLYRSGQMSREMYRSGQMSREMYRSGRGDRSGSGEAGRRHTRRRMNSGGRSTSAERRGRQRKFHSRESFISNPESSENQRGKVPKKDPAEQDVPKLQKARDSPVDPNPDTLIAERRRKRLEKEQLQLRTLYAEIAEDMGEDEEASFEEDQDDGSEETPDTLAVEAEDSRVSADEEEVELDSSSELEYGKPKIFDEYDDDNDNDDDDDGKDEGSSSQQMADDIQSQTSGVTSKDSAADSMSSVEERDKVAQRKDETENAIEKPTDADSSFQKTKDSPARKPDNSQRGRLTASSMESSSSKGGLDGDNPDALMQRESSMHRLRSREDVSSGGRHGSHSGGRSSRRGRKKQSRRNKKMRHGRYGRNKQRRRQVDEASTGD